MKLFSTSIARPVLSRAVKGRQEDQGRKGGGVVSHRGGQLSSQTGSAVMKDKNMARDRETEKSRRGNKMRYIKVFLSNFVEPFTDSGSL